MTHATRRVARRLGRFGMTTRLMTVYTLSLMVIIGLIVWQSDRVITQRLTSALNTDLVDEAQEYTGAAAGRPPGQTLAAFSQGYLQSHVTSHKLLLILGLRPSPSGPEVPALANRRSSLMTAVPQVAAWVRRPPPVTELITVPFRGASYRVGATPLLVGDRRIGTFVAAANLATLNPDRNEQLALAILEGMGALLAAVGAGYLLLRRVLRTINNVTEAAEAARAGDLAQRLPYRGPHDEVGRLAHTVDDMLGQLDAAFSSQRRLLADVSHQLRTPITIARGHLELLARQGTGPGDQETIVLVLDELTQLSLMTERLLFLGRALEPDFLLEEAVHLPTLLGELFEAAQVMAKRSWSLTGVPKASVRGDAAKLRGAILNLLDNAVRATGEEDSISVGAWIEAGEVVIEVADTGRGIAEDEQPVLFDRFRRSSTSTYGGSGLGLAIVKAVAEAHGGRVSLESRVGEGSRFRLTLPATRLLVEPASPPLAAALP